MQASARALLSRLEDARAQRVEVQDFDGPEQAVAVIREALAAYARDIAPAL
jgi:hypothetical protein